MKKFISLALALVMALSLCTVFDAPKADAAFTDADELSSKYAVQAADVIQVIEVMDGYDDGTFRPTAGLTRQAAAKIICNMILGPTTARALPTNANPFPDVLAGNQFSGYISYCSQQGIISGYADGTFRGGDPLSGYAYLKMLLGALGYSATQEGFVGDNWKVNVAKIALGIGLNKGIEEDLDGSTQVTRESAAIYAFNTLQADMVEYDAKNSIEINGVTVSMGGGNATPQTWNTSSTSVDNINASRSDGNNARPIVQFAERYFDKLQREPNGYHPNAASLLDRYQSGRDEYTQDDFGRPAIKWSWKGVEIGTYPRDPDATFVGGVDVNRIYEELGMTSADNDAHLYINSSIPNNAHLEVSRTNDKGLDNARNLLMNAQGNSSNTYLDAPSTRRVDRIGDGTLIECFRNDANNHVDVCVISVYGGKVSSVKGATARKDAYVTIDPSAEAIHRPNTILASNNNEFETEDFEEDDIVAYTYSDSAQEIKSMYLMTAESGTLQSRVSGKSLTLDSTRYNYGKEYTFDDIAGFETGLSNRSSYIVYLDANDYVLWVEEDEFAVDQYVLIERISIETTSYTGGKTTTASVIGTMETATDVSDEASSVALQNAYRQAKTSLGTSTWDARARLRYANGTVRTVTLDDSKNYRTDSNADAANLSRYYTLGVDAQNNRTVTANTNTPALTNASLSSGTGDGNGNWIALPFTAGHIARVSNNGSSYKLHALRTDETQVVVRGNVRLYNKHLVRLTSRTLADNSVVYDTNTIYYTGSDGNLHELFVDSETHFAIDDTTKGVYRTYVGIKNAPDVNADIPSEATAYIYHRDGNAKLVFITNTTKVSSSTGDIVFLAANSASNLISSDIDDYYTVTAVEKNEVKTLMVHSNTVTRRSIYMGNTPLSNNVLDLRNKANEENCVILNSMTTDSNDLITDGSFTSSSSVQARKVQGIRRVNDEEIRVNTNTSSSLLYTVAENIRIYFVDGDDIEQIDMDEIVNDTKDMVYYVEDDGEITYLFIVDYDSDANEVPEDTVLYGDREIEALDNSYQNFRYHYVNDLDGASARVAQALHGWLTTYGLAVAGASVIDNGNDTYTIGGTTYNVTKVKDGKATVSGTTTFDAAIASVQETSKVYHNFSVSGGVMTDDNASTAVANGAHTNGVAGLFVVGSTVQFTVTTAADAAEVLYEVDAGVSQRAQRVSGSNRQFIVSFTVPSNNFTVNFRIP